MKRYWKIIILPLFIVITFSVLYVHQAIAKENLPVFELVNVSGDEAVGENMIVYGEYITHENPIWESFRLSTDGIEYARERNFFEQFYAFFPSQKMEKLIEEERNFMRGKVENLNHYVEDGERLAYVETNINPLYDDTFEFQVDLLDRESRDRTSFTIDLPEQGRINHVHIDEVQIIDNIIYVMTTNHFMENKELRIYEISLENENILDSASIVEDSMYSYFYVLDNTGETLQRDALVVRVQSIEWDENTYVEETVEDEYMLYDLATGHKQTIDVPEEFMQEADIPVDDVSYYSTNETSIGEEALYFMVFSPEGLRYETYDLTENTWQEEKEIKMDDDIIDGLTRVYTKGDTVYLYSKVEENGSQVKKLFNVDLWNEKIQYEGDITLAYTPKETDVYNLEIFNIEETE